MTESRQHPTFTTWPPRQQHKQFPRLQLDYITTRKLNPTRVLMVDCEMEWTELYCQYVGKNVLNFFRQDHGYKEGSYQKIWRGREDNEYLVEIMAGLDPVEPGFKDSVYAELTKYYPG